ncbi:MAG TPA: PQ-loop domain-containing transporter [Acidimicrobiales bacterium]|nr:PQ-loop domain-containing transporter [Acidimicrobiales bacterium]
MVTLIGSLAAVMTTACWLPQMLKTKKLGTADDFSWTYLAMLLVGLVAWATYGFFRHDPPLYLCNIVTGLLVFAVAWVKVRADRRRAQLADEVAQIVETIEG